MTPASLQSLRDQVNALKWVHTINLGNGIVTPGHWPRSPLIDQAFQQVDFKDKSVVDIGCWDGLWSFEAEKRGAAEVHATDMLSQRSYPEQPTFHLAHRVLNSRVQYHPNLSVFDVKQLGQAFDIVLFCGVYYHLKHPLLALSRLREVMKPGGTIIVEGDVLVGHDASFAKFYYGTWHVNDRTTWWIPTVSCLREWVECSFFEIVAEIGGAPTMQSTIGRRAKAWLRRVLELTPAEAIYRHVIVARAVERKDPNYVCPDEDLRFCDHNDYSTPP